MKWDVITFDYVPSYDEFLHRVLVPNNACLISPELIKSWPIYSWLQSSDEGAKQSAGTLHPAFDLLAEAFGEHVVPVIVSRATGKGDAAASASYEEEEDDGGGVIRKEMPLREAVRLMKENTDMRERGDAAAQLVYIKDWHLILQEKLLRHRGKQTGPEPWYDTPDIFKDDWMNNDSGSGETEAPPDDFRFCYAGTSGTRTGLHRDVYGSYSWSTNVIGKKEWIMYDPLHAPFLLDYTESHSRHATAAARFNALPSKRIEQLPGWTLFVPSNCFHTVRNLEDTISINQNWCNSNCLLQMFQGLVEDMHKTEVALDDVKVMMREGDAARQTAASMSASSLSSSPPPPLPWQAEFFNTVQLVNKSNTGWDWRVFWQTVRDWLCRPSCRSDLHPPLDTGVKPLIRRLVDDFSQLEAYPWYSLDLQPILDECKRLAAA